MKKLLMIALLLLGSQSFAQMDSTILGAWQGEMTYTDAEGTTVTCAGTNTLTMSEDKLLFDQVLGGDCEFESHLEFDVQGEGVWQDGVQIGEMTANSLEVKNFKIDDGTYSVSLKVDSENPAQAEFSDHTDYGDGFWDSLQGQLKKCETPGPLL